MGNGDLFLNPRYWFGKIEWFRQEQVQEGLTYSAAVWSSGNDIIVQVQILVEDGSVQLSLAIKLITNPLPPGGRVCSLHFYYYCL